MAMQPSAYVHDTKGGMRGAATSPLPYNGAEQHVCRWPGGTCRQHAAAEAGALKQRQHDDHDQVDGSEAQAGSMRQQRQAP
eukprot:111919-Pelagomonas_calceolata.AAC.3